MKIFSIYVAIFFVLLTLIISGLHFTGYYTIEDIKVELGIKAAKVEDLENKLMEEVILEKSENLVVDVKNFKLKYQTINELRYEVIPEGRNKEIMYDYPIILNEILVKEGEFVKSGKLLATINKKEFQKQVNKTEKLIKNLDLKINSLSSNIKLLSSNIEVSKLNINDNKILMEKQKSGLEYGHVTEEQFNMTKINYYQSKKTLNIEEIELNEYKLKLEELKNQKLIEKEKLAKQKELIEKSGIFSNFSGFVKYNINTIDTLIKNGTPLFRIEASEQRNITFKNNKNIEKIYIIKGNSFEELLSEITNKEVRVKLPNYLKNRKAYENLELVISYTPNEKVIVISPEMVYEDRYIWVVNNLEQLEVLEIEIVGRNFNGNSEEWVVKPLKKQNVVNFNVVTNKLSNVKEKQQVSINLIL